MRLVRTIGVIGLLTIATVISLLVTDPKYKADPVPPPGQSKPRQPGGFKKPILAMELVGSPNDASTIISQTEGGGEAIRRTMYLDAGFIAAYGLLYVALSFLLARRKCPWAVYLAWVAGICGVASASFDVVENLGILKVIDAAVITQQMTNEIHDASVIKWALGFVTMAVLALAFRGLTRKASWIGYAFTLTAIVGLVGLYNKLFLPLTGIPILLGLVGICVVAFVWPRDLAPDSCK